VVDFYADWCGPCKKIAPYVHKKTKELGLALAKVNVDNAQDVSAKYGVQAMPTFQVLNSKA
jgi:thioredoxin 1